MSISLIKIHIKKILFSILLFSFAASAQAQSNEDKIKAYGIAKEAIAKMDNGEIDASIKLLEKAKKLDKKNYLYPYEIGYAYYLKKDYKSAITVLKEVIKFENNNDQCFTILGNIYDINGQPKKAIEVYKKGLLKFPSSGRLYYEMGNVEEVLENYNEALSSWEKGIKVSPTYPSNYHTAAIYYSQYTTEKIWGVLYGELFMNIERGSDKTSQLSKILYDTYQNSITISSKTEASVSFSKSNQISLPKDGEELKLPFSMPYEITMALAASNQLSNKTLGIKSFTEIRTSFINSWFDSEKNKKYPNLLFDWHKTLIDLGHFEAYNFWLFMKGDEQEFEKWLNKNQQKFDDFISWFTSNKMPISETYKFHSSQYN
ncbi:MAG: CDC27 family protein [Polaribacter sp.]